MPDFAYDHPTYVTRQQINGPELTSTATTIVGVVASAARVLRARFNVTTAGTATAGAFILQAGTTALGTATMGTAAAGSVITLDITDTNVAAGTVLNFVRSGTDATGRALACVEFHTQPTVDVG